LFDAEFFGISGREAEAMDPQQRMLLETVYEALENAGITLDQIRGTRTSVYCGAFTTANDYHALQGKDLEYYPKYAISGTGNAILSNRISYFYNLNGPSMTIDTGCSSSLVCFHLGSQSLLDREADISLVVGSALHFAPNTYQTMSDMGFMSSDGRCRSFDASGSGYVRGDGICAVVLKRYSDALEGRDRVRAVVRATAVNHDGKTDGITLPSSEAQEALIRSTYLKAGLHPDGTQYFEVR
jgi:acyl transferase domain-containing protein